MPLVLTGSVREDPAVTGLAASPLLSLSFDVARIASGAPVRATASLGNVTNGADPADGGGAVVAALTGWFLSLDLNVVGSRSNILVTVHRTVL
jgi:hypothetical protein